MGKYSNKYVPTVYKNVIPNGKNQVGWVLRTNDNEGEIVYKNNEFFFVYNDNTEVELGTVGSADSRITLQGNTFNGTSQLVQTDGTGFIPSSIIPSSYDPGTGYDSTNTNLYTRNASNTINGTGCVTLGTGLFTNSNNNVLIGNAVGYSTTVNGEYILGLPNVKTHIYPLYGESVAGASVTLTSDGDLPKVTQPAGIYCGTLDLFGRVGTSTSIFREKHSIIFASSLLSQDNTIPEYTYSGGGFSAAITLSMDGSGNISVDVNPSGSSDSVIRGLLTLYT